MKIEQEVSPVCRIEITKVNTSLKRQFKAACSLNETNMREAIIELMKQYVNTTRKDERPNISINTK